MFWKKKQSETKAEVPAPPKAEMSAPPKTEKLAGPRSIEELVGRHIVLDLKQDPDWTWQLRSVVRPRADGTHRFDFRIFDEAQAAQKKVKVRDWTTFDQNPELILYQGWFDKVSMEVHFEEQKQQEKTVSPVPSDQILTENEIWQRIIGLSEPGSTVFFYLSGSPSSGGPLGRGAAVVELNPNYPGPKQKRYILYIVNVEGMQPVGKGTRFFDSDKSKEIAWWIKERHHKRMY